MGAVLDPTPAMGAWRAEVRIESACLLRNAAPVQPPGVFALPATERAQLVAALDQIERHPAYRAWHVEHIPEPGGEWSLAERDGLLHITGPALVYSHEATPETSDTIEIDYRNLANLRLALEFGVYDE